MGFGNTLTPANAAHLMCDDETNRLGTVRTETVTWEAMKGDPTFQRPPSHPGHHLIIELNTLSWTRAEFAERIDVDSAWLDRLLDGNESMTALMALKLSFLFGSTARFWMNLQQHYDLAVASMDPSIMTAISRIVPLTDEERAHAYG